MKFKKIPFNKKWSSEETEMVISRVQADIAKLNQQQNDVDSRMNVLREEKRSVQIKIGNKTKYLQQLRDQLSGFEWHEI